MRPRLAVLLALAAAAPAGCFTAPPDRSVSRFEAQVPFTGLAGDDVVQLDVYLVERPAGDRCISREAWELADEQALGECKPLLEENGLRVGVLGGTPPDGLRALLRSERSCANPRRLRLHAGKPAWIVLGPTTPELSFRLRQDGRTADVDLEQAQCVLQATTRIADDGRLVLQCTPAVRHGLPLATPRPVQDPSGTLRWDVRTEQPTETYRALGWELAVTPDTYLAVGMAPERPDTYGEAAFLSAGPPATERLLVLRPGRARVDGPPADGTNGTAPPLAVQAGKLAARGMAP